ncbi:MAG: hypothetical protein IKF37_03315 [Bacilli bacterium]|nr:hypothetical protein [Bacilli bacterium]
MDLLNVVLPVLLYIVAIILLIVLTVVGIKLISILDKVDKIVENVDNKVNSFNGLFSVLGRATDGLASISDSVIFGVSSAVSKVFNKYKKKEEDI